MSCRIARRSEHTAAGLEPLLSQTARRPLIQGHAFQMKFILKKRREPAFRRYVSMSVLLSGMSASVHRAELASSVSIGVAARAPPHVMLAAFGSSVSRLLVPF